MEETVLFQLLGLDVSLPIFLSCLGIVLLGIIQVSWPALKAYLSPPPRALTDLPPPPIIETISADPKREKARKRFVKDKSSIANWAANAPTEGERQAVEDPNTMLPVGINRMNTKEVIVNDDGKVLDVDGSVIEPETVAYIRQQLIDRVINAGTTGDDENESAVMKLDIIKSIRDLTDANVIEWYIHNKEMLSY